MTARSLLILSITAAPTTVFGQFTEFRAWTAPPGEDRVQPTSACSSLRALTGYEFSVVSAVVETAPAGGGEFCRVLGQVLPRVKFEVALPVSWNKRLVMIGNGGYAGENLESPQRGTLRYEAVRAGFVFTQTNTGHDDSEGSLGAFATDPEALIDSAFRAVHVTAETAKKIAAAYYGTAPARPYFVGCSTGGRQALISAQRFPQDFDGILAGAPVLDFVGTMVNYAGVLRAFEAAPIPPDKMALVAEAVYSMCDEKDGVKDGDHYGSAALRL
jgi:Tannase and feruloyl esterase